MVNTGVLPLPPERPAGAEYHVYYLSNHLAKLGAEVHLVTEVKTETDFHSNIVLHDFRFRHPPLRRFTGWLLTHFIGGLHSFIKYLEVHRKISPDIVHIHGRLAPRLISMLKSHGPKVYTLHDQSPFTASFRGTERFVRAAAYLAQEYRTARKVDHVIAVSRLVYKELIEWIGLPPSKVSYIPNGVDVEYFKPANEKEPYILFVGRLTRRKGVDVLLKAFSKIWRDSPEARLLIVGEGEEKNRLKVLAGRLGIRSRTHFLGNLPRSRLRDLYAKASLFALPSKGEGLPLSLLEAMSSECAIVATKVSGVTDVIEHSVNGFLVEPDNVDQLAENLLRLLTDASLRRKLAENARRTVEKKYSWDTIARRTLTVYRKLLEDSK